MINQVELKQYLHYDPETGFFTWLRRPAPICRVVVGSRAGHISHDGYWTITINRKVYGGHSIAWLYTTGGWPEFEIDHKNRVRHNNAWNNLRDVTRKINQQNLSISKLNKSGKTGVNFFVRDKKWEASIYTPSGRKHLGRFKTLEEAIAVRIAAEKQYFA